MDTLEIDVRGWPEDYVRLVKKYVEERRRDLERNGLPKVPAEDREALAVRGVIRRGTQHLSHELKEPPVGQAPSGVLAALLRERENGR